MQDGRGRISQRVIGEVSAEVGGFRDNLMGYSFQQLEQIWIQNGGNRAAAPIAAAIALAESGGNSNAVNYNTNGSTDRGLWQINSVHGSQSTFDVNGNAQAAIAISNNGGNWNPWTTYTSGAYRSFLPSGASTSPQYVGLFGIPNPFGIGPLPFLPNIPFNAIGTLAGDIGSAASNITGLGGIGKAIQNLADVIKFIFSYRFFYMIGGGVLLLLGLYLLARNQDLAPSPTNIVKAGATLVE